MDDYKLFPAEYRMMDLFWDNEPMSTTQLVHLCEQEFGWKKTTTFTQMKRMVDRGFIKKDDLILSAQVSRDMVEQYDSSEVINDRFSGSLPKFIAAFLGGRSISEAEIDELRKMLDKYKNEQMED